MTINIKRYIDITSGVGAGATVRERELIGMLFSSDPKVPIDSVVTFENASDALNYFGSGSEEYKRAVFYFDFVSKTITSPKKISFARYSPEATSAQIFGVRSTSTVASWKTVTSGNLIMTVGENTANLSGLDFSAVTTLADVASTVQTALRAVTGFESATVSYEPLTTSYVFSLGTTGSTTISVTTSDVATRLGWNGALTIFSPGTNAEEPIDAFTRAADRNNNFGSFLFINSLTDNQIVQVAQANSSRNIEFMYCIPTTESDAESLASALLDISGTAISLTAIVGEYDEMAPMILLAATDYSRRNATINYMFNEFNLTAKVDSSSLADFYDGIRVNYYGVTQTAGQQITFYQRGIMGGGSTMPVDMNTYCNEMWLKDACAARILSLLLSMPKVSANAEGRGLIITILQDAIDQALYNGTISVGKTLSTQQKLYITNQTGDPDAWYQVQSIGYWLDCSIAPYTTTDSRTEYKATYILIYSKDDVIRKVEGTHILT